MRADQAARHWDPSRRNFISAGAAATSLWLAGSDAAAQEATAPEVADAEPGIVIGEVRAVAPRGRVPVSFVIDDSTCLVNLAHFAMPQFAAAWPEREDYRKPWQSWPREIPDEFVRRFGEWSHEHGVKGKYSIVPYPALVGWVDRELPGWSRKQLQDSLQLVRELMVPDWDIHPEMITHTRVIDIKSGRPLEQIDASAMENWYPREPKSVDELAGYLAYALQILKNCGLPCEGVTTPGGFGNSVKSELSLAVGEAVRDVAGVEIPHYFKYVMSGQESTEPRLEHVRRSDGGPVELTVTVPAGTGDWFGGWDGVSYGDVGTSSDRFITADLQQGRMVELIRRGQPAVMLCHWPGIYCNGTEIGFQIFQTVVRRLEEGYRDQILWMKLSEMARYWAAKELTQLRAGGNRLTIAAPFACEQFTIEFTVAGEAAEFQLITANGRTTLRSTDRLSQLNAGMYFRDGQKVTLCFALPKGESELLIG